MSNDRDIMNIPTSDLTKGEINKIIMFVKDAIDKGHMTRKEGMSRLSWVERPNSVHGLQVAAAVGQTGLVQAYESQFQEYGRNTAQILLDHDDIMSPNRLIAHNHDINNNTNIRFFFGDARIFDDSGFLYNRFEISIDKDNFDSKIFIRNQRHTIPEAINRQMMHYAYHVGQMVFLGKMIKGKSW